MSVDATSTQLKMQLGRGASTPVPRVSGVLKSSFTAWLWGNDGLTVGDLIDVVNPLQHVPIVATIYRALSRDVIAAGPRLLGGALFGGLIGFGTAAANTLVERFSGKDVGEHLLALLHAPIQADSSTAVASMVSPTSSSPASPANHTRALSHQTFAYPVHSINQRLSTSPVLSQNKAGAEANQEETPVHLSARAARQLRIAAALDAYTRRDHLLTAVRSGGRVDTMF